MKSRAYLGWYGEWLDGARSYMLNVPADPPAKLFWSATVHDIHARCLIDNVSGADGRAYHLMRTPNTVPSTICLTYEAHETSGASAGQLDADRAAVLAGV